MVYLFFCLFKTAIHFSTFLFLMAPHFQFSAFLQNLTCWKVIYPKHLCTVLETSLCCSDACAGGRDSYSDPACFTTLYVNFFFVLLNISRTFTQVEFWISLLRCQKNIWWSSASNYVPVWRKLIFSKNTTTFPGCQSFLLPFASSEVFPSLGLSGIQGSFHHCGNRWVIGAM